MRIKFLTGSGKKLTRGAKYFFVDTSFNYLSVEVPTIKERTVYRIITGDFSTKEPGDTYEVERFIAFETREEAQKYALKKLKEYKKYINNSVKEAIIKLTNPTEVK